MEVIRLDPKGSISTIGDAPATWPADHQERESQSSSAQRTATPFSDQHDPAAPFPPWELRPVEFDSDHQRPTASSPSHSELSCQLCGEQNLERFEIPGKSVLQFCEPCELYQFGRHVDQRAYAEEYHDGYERRRRQKVRTAMTRIGRISRALSVKTPHLLEVGSSVGCTLEAANRFGWQATGVDVSESTVERCRERGFDCRHVGPLELPFDDESFDILVSFHVIEHVMDVRQTLAEWRRVLKPDGLLFLETPDASSPKVRRLGRRYRKFWAAEHTYTFAPSNLNQFVTQVGFDLLPIPNRAQLPASPISDRLYASIYQNYMRARRALGIHKAFQLLARKRVEG